MNATSFCVTLLESFFFLGGVDPLKLLYSFILTLCNDCIYQSLFNVNHSFFQAMDIDSIIALSEAIEVNTMLEEIWLNTNNVGAAGMAPFLRALGKNQGLKKVMLGGNGIGDVTNRVPFEMYVSFHCVFINRYRLQNEGKALICLNKNSPNPCHFSFIPKPACKSLYQTLCYSFTVHTCPHTPLTIAYGCMHNCKLAPFTTQLDGDDHALGGD